MLLTLPLNEIFGSASNMLINYYFMQAISHMTSLYADPGSRVLPEKTLEDPREY